MTAEPMFRKTPPSPSGVQVAAGIPANLDLAIVELGYNPSSNMAADIDAMMSTLNQRGTKRVVWVNMADVRGSYAAANAALEQAPTWTGSHPVVDEAAIGMALQAMSREKLAAMVETFLDQAPETVQRLRAAVRDAQPLDLRTNAHAAKGAALNLGMSALAATAEALHEGAAHLPAHEIARLVQRYEDLVPATRQAMSALDVLRAEPQPAVTE